MAVERNEVGTKVEEGLMNERVFQPSEIDEGFCVLDE